MYSIWEWSKVSIYEFMDAVKQDIVERYKTKVWRKERSIHGRRWCDDERWMTKVWRGN